MDIESDLNPMTKSSMGFLSDRRVSHNEFLRRQSWLQRARSSQHFIRTRGSHLREHYRASFPDTYGGLNTLRYSLNGEALVTGFGSGIIQVRDPDTGELKGTIRSNLDANMPVMSCRFHPTKTNTFFACCADGIILQCDSEHYEMFRFAYEENNQVNALDLSPDGKHLISGGKDTALRVYDLETRQLIKTYCRSMLDQSDNVRFHTLKIFAIRVHDNMHSIFVSGGWDASLKIWDLRVDNGCVAKIRGPHISGDAIDLKTNFILTGSWVHKDSLQLWDLRTYTLLKNLSPMNRPVPPSGEFLYSAHFFDGDPYGDIVIAGGSGIKAVEAFSIKDRVVIGRFPVTKTIHAVDSHSTMLAYGGMDPWLYISSFS